MSVNYQIIVDMIANIGIVTFPIALIFVICGRISGAFMDFVGGNRVKL